MNKKFKEILSYIIIIVVVILIRSFIISPARVNGDSMDDTLFDKEFVFVYKYLITGNKYDRFDIVVIREEKEYLIKRLIGLPNEKIEYKDNILYINDKEVKLPFEFEETNNFIYYLEDNEYFVLGDNRDVSKDSRWFGPVSKKQIKGTVNFVFYPFSKWGKVK